MMEDMKQHQNMLFVTPRLSGADVISNHVTNSNQAVLVSMREIGGKCGCSDLRKMLVFRNSEHFLFGEAAQSHAILKSNHESISLNDANFALYELR
jgi:hypothetical protein